MLAFLFYLLRLRRYKAKRVKTRCYQEGVGHLKPRFLGEGAVPGEYFFGFYKTRHILLSNCANCAVFSLIFSQKMGIIATAAPKWKSFRAVVLTQYRRVMDGQTERQTELL